MIKFYKSIPPYGYLNNFDKHPINIFDRIWNTVEHAYQAQKCYKWNEYDLIWTAKTPKEARDLGQKISIRSDWDRVKYDIMKVCIEAKFTQHQNLKELLLSTGDEEIVEDSAIDFYWGCGSDNSGLNNLGKILMDVRFQFKK